jgi:hypothetical protein
MTVVGQEKGPRYAALVAGTSSSVEIVLLWNIVDHEE